QERPRMNSNSSSQSNYRRSDGSGERRGSRGVLEARPRINSNSSSQGNYRRRDGSGERRGSRGVLEARPRINSNSSSQGNYRRRDGSGERRGSRGVLEARPRINSNSSSQGNYRRRDGSGERRGSRGEPRGSRADEQTTAAAGDSGDVPVRIPILWTKDDELRYGSSKTPDHQSPMRRLSVCDQKDVEEEKGIEVKNLSSFSPFLGQLSPFSTPQLNIGYQLMFLPHPLVANHSNIALLPLLFPSSFPFPHPF
ncbi:hypothetical protein PRIPAC_84256, partial [Pristionchus pacificus]|uniref:Uncharacterized protein n=1 Tax=Pristionchus pacificus TaxID=54126 RepID=A0A2A6BLC1_PRIPA